jgi:hypothetical protein
VSSEIERRLRALEKRLILTGAEPCKLHFQAGIMHNPTQHELGALLGEMDACQHCPRESLAGGPRLIVLRYHERTIERLRTSHSGA